MDPSALCDPSEHLSGPLGPAEAVQREGGRGVHALPLSGKNTFPLTPDPELVTRRSPAPPLSPSGLPFTSDTSLTCTFSLLPY
jgi:hypothetical protein